MKIVLLLCFVISTIACTTKEIQTDSISEIINQIVEFEDTNSLQNNENKNVIIKIGEEKLQYFGTVLNAIIKFDNVNVFDYPSFESNALFQVHKNTEITIVGALMEFNEIDSYVGHWLLIKIGGIFGKGGWIFCKFDESEQIPTSELKINEMPPREERRAQRLIASYQVNGIETNVTLYPYKIAHQDFYTFAYDFFHRDFHYTNLPGSYAWFPDTNELRHVSYIGTTLEAGWVVFTDDFKYLIQDIGTAPPPRGLEVWRLKDSKRIFTGMYYENINLRGNTIDYIYPVYSLKDTNWIIQTRRQIDQEIINYANEYKENNPVSNDMINYSRQTGLGIDLIIICELDLDSGIRTIITINANSYTIITAHRIKNKKQK
jgi:hypothetical protein